MQIEDFDLPQIILPEATDIFAVKEKYGEELFEWRFEPDPAAQLVEAWDVLQVTLTWVRCPGSGYAAISAFQTARGVLERYAKDARDVMVARQTALIKNAARQYYAPSVCQRIIETGGAEWRIDNADN